MVVVVNTLNLYMYNKNYIKVCVLYLNIKKEYLISIMIHVMEINHAINL